MPCTVLQRTLTGLCRQIHAHREAEGKERQAEMELLSADPFDPEAQARIAERIRQAQVEENYQTRLRVHARELQPGHHAVRRHGGTKTPDGHI